MSQEKNLYEASPTLWSYFKDRTAPENQNPKGNLRVMATIADESGAVQWAIFFGVKGERPPTGPQAGDRDFHFLGSSCTQLTPGSGLTGLSWRNKRPLWLVPITPKARKEAYLCVSNNSFLPNIPAPRISIHNPGRAGGNWDYDFDSAIRNPTVWKADPKLTLSSDTKLTELSRKGNWVELQLNNETRWPVWLTTEVFDTAERLIVFNAPQCHIVNPDGKFLTHSVWFGVRQHESGQEVQKPFIAVGEPGIAPPGNASPLVWRNTTRLDDVFEPRPKTNSSISVVEIDDWKKVTGAGGIFDESPFKEPSAEKTDTIKFNKTFEAHAEEQSPLRAWMIGEEEKDSSGNVYRSFHLIYFRHYLLLRSANPQQDVGTLAGLLGRNELLPNEQYIRNFQVCRSDTSHIFVRIRLVEDKELNRAWAVTRNVRTGLQAIAGAAPIGVAPEIEGFPTVAHTFVGQWKTVVTKSCQSLQPEFDLAATRMVPVRNGGIGNAAISLRMLRDESNKPSADSRILLKDAKLNYVSGGESVADNGTLFRFILEGYTLKKNIRLRDGSLVFALDDKTPTEFLPPNKLGHFKITLQLQHAQAPFFLWQWYAGLKEKDEIVCSYSVDDFSLPVISVEAAGQDAMAKDKLVAPRSLGTAGEGFGERSEPALVIPLSPKNTTTETAKRYLLSFSESVNVSQDFRVDIKLQEFNPAAGASQDTEIKAIVLDANPQLVALVDARFLQQPGYDDGAWVLARRSPLSEEAGGWELLDDSAGTAGFNLILPSQAIGEAYVKGRHEQPSPVPSGEPKPDEAIDYRLGAAAVLRLAPERLEKHYVAVPWNLRRILGQPGDSAPGIPFLESYFELLYGLPAHLTPEKAFLAELASKLGEVPVPPVNSLAWAPTQTQRDSFRTAWQQYLRFYRAWKSRLAILEPSTGDDFANASFDKNLSFTPRIGFIPNKEFEEKLDKMVADIAQRYPNLNELEAFKKAVATIKLEINGSVNYPVMVTNRNFIIEVLAKIAEQVWIDDITQTSHLLKIGASLKNPVAGQTTLVSDDLLEEKIRVAHEPNGLAGGFHYGFESRAIYKEFWREAFSKGSSSAEIKSPAFSSLGGWGRQTARFAGDKTVIRSTTSMGRTHFYAVERIGRIGVFWNKAKHVIEYERTVVPSKQFTGDQPEHAGRPLVRKVREYIEILEPSRHYPDFKSDVPESPGSVMACTFKSVIIPVLSTWGHDVVGATQDGSGEKDMIGWEVPLWKRGANPDLYPKPQVILSLLPPPSDEKAVLHNLSEPENLWFYTDTREKVIGENQQEILITADVHAWPAVQNVDFSDMPEPRQYDMNPSIGESAEELEQPMPDVLDVLPGFERYTFLVDRNEIPASVAGRYYATAAITGRMRTVTMTRSLYRKNEAWIRPDEAASLAAAKHAVEALIYGPDSLLARSANGFEEVVKKVVAGNTVSVEQYTNKLLADINGSDILAKIRNINGQIGNPKLKYLDDTTLWTSSRLSFHPFKWLWRESLEGGDGIVGRVLDFYNVQRRRIEKELQLLIESGSEVISRADELLDRFEGQIEKFETEYEFTVDTAFSAILKLLQSAQESATQTVADEFEDLKRLIDKLDPSMSMQEMQQQLNKKNDEVFEQVKKVFDKLFQTLKKINNTTWRSKMDALKTQLDWERNELQRTIALVINQTAGTGKNYVDEVRRKITARVDEYKAKANEFLTTIVKEAKGLVAEARDVYEEVSAKFREIQTGIRAKLSATIVEIRKQWAQGTGEMLSVLKTNLDAMHKEILVVAKDKVTLILGKPTDAPGTVYNVLKNLDDVCKDLVGAVRASMLEFFAELSSGPVGAIRNKLEQWLGTLDAYRRLEDAINRRDKDAILSASVALANSVNREFGRLAGEVGQKLKDVEKFEDSAHQVIQAGQQTLNNFRSVWEEFTAPGMGLNRRTVAMIVRTDWKDVEQRLSITPCISRVKQFGEELEGLGLRVPVAAITDRLLPAKAEWKEMKKSLMSKFDFSNLFSDLGGMRFDKLLPGLKMPEFARDKIKLTHGFDKQNLSAWVNSEANIFLSGRKKMMSIGPLQIELENGHFIGKARIEMDIDGKIRKINSGQLKGSWHLNIAGTGIMIFRDTAVNFRDGKLSFDLDPRRMEMPGLLKMLTDASTKLSDSGMSGGGVGEKKEVFKVGIVKVREIPAGVRAQLNIPPVSVGGGTTAITNLSFGGHFELLALDPQLRFKFLLGLGFYLGKKEAPFNVTIFILGGGGYVDCALTFAPKEGLAIDFVISVHASVSLAIALGWMTGFVAIMVGFEGEYHKTPKQGSSVYITIFVRVIGVVDILSLITIFLYLSLEATYRASGKGSQLVGTGTVSVEIRICRFVKIKVRKSYSKTFAGSGNSGSGEMSMLETAIITGIQLPEFTRKANNILHSLA